MNMAIDEAILQAKLRNCVPNTLRFYCWYPSAVSLGKFQNLEKEVNRKECRKHNVDIVRRISGGGAVYHAKKGEITYSVVVSKEDVKAKNVKASYIKIYGGIVEALKILGLKGEIDEGNLRNCPNLKVNGKKISGSAQAQKKGVLLQHGTLLLDVDLNKMFTFLKVPWAKTREEIINVAKNKITSIKELRKSVPLNESYKALRRGFQRALKITFDLQELTSYEQTLTLKLYKEKYTNRTWNFKGVT